MHYWQFERDEVAMTHLDSSTEISAQTSAGGIFLLIDAAQYPGVWRILQYRFRRLPWVSLAFDNQATSAPILVHAATNQTRTLAWFLEHTKDMHCLSWIESPLSLSDLADHLRKLMRVEANDGASYDIRYYDTRILSAWYQMLDASQEACVLGPITSWTYLDRDGMPCTLFGQANPEIRVTAMLKLTADQEKRLLAAALPDIVLEQLEQNGNADLAAMPRAQRYAFVADQVNKATSQYGIVSTQELVLFCSLALGIGRNFDKLLPVAQVLRKFGGAACEVSRPGAYSAFQSA
ncbi:uncharacterized protein DUF4123 [Paucimonas lemoignei]|uniref:Uncharacterized protein DUF4123 n=1 Tax=Paucimonas lemoignei TaxID=29443 RepID=A0A4R3I1X8_PAULE|nr:DUF4123 domain-containing protein [Paucimonas lemoignei]TCS39214.1 uncharacterized protein DUF4123 [Paucimonas lemoignei]